MKIFISCLAIFLLLLISVSLPAEDKSWSGSGDGVNWADDDNWFIDVEPTNADDVSIDLNGASVTCTETFSAKSITLGGRETSDLISNNFVFGTVSPDSTSDIAILNRSGGVFTLKGSGVVTLQGSYKDSEESLTSEPSFMFWVQ
ncbi:MAG: hypothetical protein ABIH08_04805 [Candidatus Omnitrophota bacterium]